MRKQGKYFLITLAVSVLAGIIPPLILGVKDLTLIAITFSLVWFFYAVVMLITTFLIKPGLGIKVSRQNGISVVRYELRDAEKKN